MRSKPLGNTNGLCNQLYQDAPTSKETSHEANPVDVPSSALSIIGDIDGYPLAAGQNDYWGALAYSNATGRFGFAYDYPTQAQAINVAVEKCRARDCRGVVWFHNGCGAFARGNRAWGWAIGDTREEAQERVLAECRKHGGGCRGIAWACTTR